MPLYFLPFGRGWELFLRDYRFSGILMERGEQIEKGTLDLDSNRFAIASVFVLLWPAWIYRLAEP